MNILMKAYASCGDIYGAMKVIARIGTAVRTSEVNSALAAILKNPKLDHWDMVVTLHREFFSPDRLVPDNETYEQFLLICAKYGRSDDALFWFEDFLSHGKKVTNAVTRAFRAAVDETTYNQHAHRHFYDPENLDTTLVNYRKLMASTPVPVTPPATALVGNIAEAYELLQSRIKAPKDSAELKLSVRRHISLGDLVGARQTITLAASDLTYSDDETVLSLMHGYASHGDYLMAESLFEDSRHHGSSSKGSCVRAMVCHVMSFVSLTLEHSLPIY
jgi:tetratricopeptide (TPR) repeat protein